MLWNVDTKGFLPSCEPLLQLPISNYKNTQLVFALENMAHMMPCFLNERRWREEIVYELRQVISKFGPVLIDKLSSPAELERAFLLFAMFANGYMFSVGDTHKQKLPDEIAIPLNKAAKLCERRPSLDYTSYILYNWQQPNPTTIEALLTFTDTETEKKIITAHAEQAFDVAVMINSRKADSPLVYMEKWKTTLNNLLNKLNRLSDSINPDELKTLKEYLPEDLFTQAPVFSLLYKVFSVKSPEAEMCDYRPRSHNQFIETVSPMMGLIEDQATRNLYNDCLELFIDLHRAILVKPEWSKERIQILEKYKQGVS